MYSLAPPILFSRAATFVVAHCRRFRPKRTKSFARPLKAKAAKGFRLASDSVKPRERLLLFIALDGAPQGLDPIRLQKGMFLFAMDDDTDPREGYQFVPYNYGPMSAQIYRDLELLSEQGLVEAVPVEGQSWARYSATEQGLATARDLLNEEPTQVAAQRLYEIKLDVSSHSFKEVLEDVYDRYPEFASKSVFRRAS
jgi:DNA-binding PadR family transcriptional regulator